MSDDPARRWPDDSPEEDFAVHQATELDGIDRRGREQKLRPLTDALAEHGIGPGGAAESWCSAPVVPDWWLEVPEPGGQCPWCQRPGVPAPCPECRAAREQDPPAVWAWWASLAPARRRLYLAARHGTDPWTGRRVRLEAEWTDIIADEIATARRLFHPITPTTAWDLAR
jgi:hypothetical protein